MNHTPAHSLPFVQDISRCLRSDGGPLDDAALAAVLDRAGPELQRLQALAAEGSMALLALPARRDDLEQLGRIATDWRDRFSRVVLFGTGGSSLGAQALAALVAAPALELCVPDNLDAADMDRLLAPAALAGTGFLVISKSGGTGETMSQALAAAGAARAALGSDAAGARFLMIAEPGESPLRRLAAELSAPVLHHDPDIGGRFSVLSLVGLLPALMLGVDAATVRAGAQAVMDATLAAGDPAAAPPLVGAALNVALAEQGMASQSVLLAYDRTLQPFTRWYRQLWAESLGKGGHGTTPIDALGPVDQHSQLQLWLDGPADKLFNVITAPQAGRGPQIDAGLAARVGADHLAGHHTGDLVAAMQQATIDTLAGRARPVRQLALQRLDAAALGGLFMHFILETMFAAWLFGVDPFGQPAVEEGKVLARRYLAEGAP